VLKVKSCFVKRRNVLSVAVRDQFFGLSTNLVLGAAHKKFAHDVLSKQQFEATFKAKYPNLQSLLEDTLHATTSAVAGTTRATPTLHDFVFGMQTVSEKHHMKIVFMASHVERRS
jgi:hypothetical protein